MAAMTAMARASSPLDAWFTTPALVFGTLELLAGPFGLLVVPLPLPLVLVEAALEEALLEDAIELEEVVALVFVVMLVAVVGALVVVAVVEVEAADDVAWVVVWVGEALLVMALLEAALLRPEIWKRGRKLYWPPEEMISIV